MYLTFDSTMGKRKSSHELNNDTKSKAKVGTGNGKGIVSEKKQRRDKNVLSRHGYVKSLKLCRAGDVEDDGSAEDKSLITEVDAVSQNAVKQNSELKSKLQLTLQEEASNESDLIDRKPASMMKNVASKQQEDNQRFECDVTQAAVAEFGSAQSSGNLSQMLHRFLQAKHACTTMPGLRLPTDFSSHPLDAIDATQRVQAMMVLQDLDSLQQQRRSSLLHPFQQQNQFNTGASLLNFDTYGAKSVRDRQALFGLMEQNVDADSLFGSSGTLQPSLTALLTLENHALNNHAGTMHRTDKTLELIMRQQQQGQGVYAHLVAKRNSHTPIAHWLLSELRCDCDDTERKLLNDLRLAQHEESLNRYSLQLSSVNASSQNRMDSAAAMQHRFDRYQLPINQAANNNFYLQRLSTMTAKDDTGVSNMITQTASVPPRILSTSKSSTPVTSAGSNRTARPHVTIVNISFELFPVKLYRLLFDAQQKGQQHIVSFTPSGNALAVHQPNEFMRDIAPLYFKITSLASFQRQLYIYGFHRTMEGDIKDAYMNPNFKKDRPELLEKIHRGGH
jgi:hypothetical protein